ncbi:MAG: metal ABC transporter substrate-binding protein [bacterium]|nr:metal ABC transporter substrate-binding protein [bacterium]
MKIRRCFLTYILLLLLYISNLFAQEIITTTSVLSSAVKEIVKGKLKVENLVPSGYCPGHSDIKVKHLAEIEKSGLLFAHGFEPYLDQIKNSIKKEGFSPIIIKTEGTCFSLENQKKIYNELTKILSEKFPQYKDFFETNSKKTLLEIEETDKKIKNIIKKKQVAGISVICNGYIKNMLEYLGLEVIATYGRKEDLSPSQIKKLIEIGRKEKVSLVIDNLQAGPDTGKGIAEELRIPHITISNFPEALPDTPTLRDTLYVNTQRIIEAYEKNKIR